MPTRFAALDAAMASAGVVIEREAIQADSGLDAISVLSDSGDDHFVIMRSTATRSPSDAGAGRE